jgi:hypothetical protein
MERVQTGQKPRFFPRLELRISAHADVGAQANFPAAFTGGEPDVVDVCPGEPSENDVAKRAFSFGPNDAQKCLGQLLGIATAQDRGECTLRPAASVERQTHVDLVALVGAAECGERSDRTVGPQCEATAQFRRDAASRKRGPLDVGVDPNFLFFDARNDERVRETPEMGWEGWVGAERLVLSDDDVARYPEFA